MPGLDPAIDPLPRRFLKMGGRVKPAHGTIISARFLLFFILSKTLGAALLPINLLVELGIVSVVLMATRFAGLGRKLAATTLVLLALAAFSPLGNLLLYPLESRFPAVGSVARCARRHHRAGRLGRYRSVGGTSHAGGLARGRSLVCAGRACAPLSECAHRLHRRHCEPGLDRCQGSRLLRADPGKPRHIRRSA